MYRPTNDLTRYFLCRRFRARKTTFTRFRFFFPINENTRRKCAILVFGCIFRLFVVSLSKRLPAQRSKVMTSCKRLINVRQASIFNGKCPRINERERQDEKRRVRVLYRTHVKYFNEVSLSRIVTNKGTKLRQVMTFPLYIRRQYTCAYVRARPNICVRVIFNMGKSFLSTRNVTITNVMGHVFLRNTVVCVLCFQNDCSQARHVISMLYARLSIILQRKNMIGIRAHAPIASAKIRLKKMVMSILCFVNSDVNVFCISIRPRLVFIM